MSNPIVHWRCRKCKRDFFSGYYTREHKPRCQCDWDGGDCHVVDLNFKPDKQNWNEMRRFGGEIDFEKSGAWQFSKYVIEAMSGDEEHLPF